MKGMEIVSGTFLYGHTVGLIIDGKELKRKVHYTTADGCYIVYQNERIRNTAFVDNRRR